MARHTQQRGLAWEQAAHDPSMSWPDILGRGQGSAVCPREATVNMPHSRVNKTCMYVGLESHPAIREPLAQRCVSCRILGRAIAVRAVDLHSKLLDQISK